VIDVILGLQWGDEGKGKIVDFLADRYDIVARFQGGPNAGHTLKFDGKKYVLHTVPSGIFRANLLNIVGNGVVLDPITFERELQNLDAADVEYRSRLFIAKKAHLILPSHCLLDAASEAAKGKDKIGSTLKGIGPTYMDKTGRNGLRVGDILLPNFEEKYKALKDKHLAMAIALHAYDVSSFNLQEREENFFKSIETLRKLQLIDGEYFINNALKSGKKILAEGAQGSMLDVDFGTYPFVTSSNTITAGVCNGLGVAPQTIKEVIGITKAYCTRVGGGPFPTEQDNAVGEFLRQEGGEWGATTGRARRCGWIDLPQLKYTIMLNGVTQLCITKIDVMNAMETIKSAESYTYNGQTSDQLPFDICDIDIQANYTQHNGWQTNLDGIETFEHLPPSAQNYIHYLEKQLNCPISMVSTGPEREKLILR
jgi:adenylosuccinate synthase